MAKKLISFNFNGEFVPEFSSLIKTYPIAEINTIYCTSAPSRVPNLNTDTYLAEAMEEKQEGLWMIQCSIFMINFFCSKMR
jgi:hypothetical protein